MALSVKCTCGAVLGISEEQVGTRTKCPKCGKVFVISDRVKRRSAAGMVKAPEAPPDANCSKCGSPLDPDAVICLNCGSTVKRHGPTRKQVSAAARGETPLPESPSAGVATQEVPPSAPSGATPAPRKTAAAAQAPGAIGKSLANVGGFFSALAGTLRSRWKMVAGVAAALAVVALGAFLIVRGFKRNLPPPPSKFAQKSPAKAPPGQQPSKGQPTAPPARPAAPKPTLARFTDRALECGRRLALVRAALAKYVAAHGSYPQNLDQLVPGFVSADAVASICCPEYKGEADLDKCYGYVGAEAAGLPRSHLLVWDREPRHPRGEMTALFGDGLIRPVTAQELNDVTLAKSKVGNIWVTPAEEQVLTSFQPEVRVANERLSELDVLMDGASIGKVACGQEAVIPVSGGAHKFVLAANGRQSREIELSLANGYSYRLAAPKHSNLPIIYIRTYAWYSQPTHPPNAAPPPGPKYSPVLIGPPSAGPRPPRGSPPAGPQILVGLRSPLETLQATSAGTAQPPGLMIDEVGGLVYATIRRGKTTFSGLSGQPIKVSPIQRLAEGQAVTGDGAVLTCYHTPLGTVTCEVTGNVRLAEFAELRPVAGVSPWKNSSADDLDMEDELYMRRLRVMLPGQPPRNVRTARAVRYFATATSFDGVYPSLVGYCDVDAIASQIRRFGRPFAKQILARISSAGSSAAAPTGSAAETPMAFFTGVMSSYLDAPFGPPEWMGSPTDEDETTISTTFPDIDQKMLMDESNADDAAGLRAPGVQLDASRMSQISMGLPKMGRALNMGTPRGDGGGRLSALGFYLDPSRASALAPFAQGKDPQDVEAAILALGRIGSPLSVGLITGWKGWENGEPTEQKQEVDPDEADGRGPSAAPRAKSLPLSGPPVATVVALAMLDSPLGAATATRLEWMRAKAPKESAPETTRIGRQALKRILAAWTPDQLAYAMQAWPPEADFWPRRNFIMALAASGNPNLDDVGVLAACFRFEPGATLTMCRYLTAKSPSDSVNSARLLCRAGDPEAVTRLLGIAQTAGPGDATPALQALAELGDPALIPLLQPAVEKIVKNGAPEIKINALNAWVSICLDSGADLSPAIKIAQGLARDGNAGVRDAATRAFAAVGGRVTPQTALAMLDKGDKPSKILALQIVAAAGDQKAVPKLAGLLKDKDVDIKIAAVQAAAALKASGLSDQIRQDAAITDRRFETYAAACAQALGKLVGEPAVPDLQLLLISPSPKIRAAAATALGEMGAEKAVPNLTKLIDDRSDEVRVAARLALAGVHAAAGHFPQVAAYAFSSSNSLTPPTWPPLRALVQANSPEAYAALRQAIGREQVWKLWSVVNAVYLTVPRDQRGPCVAFLGAFLKSDDKWLRVLAAHAMAELDVPELARPFLTAPDVDKTGIIGPIARVTAAVRNPQDALLLRNLLENYARLQLLGTPPGSDRSQEEYPPGPMNPDDAHQPRLPPGRRPPPLMPPLDDEDTAPTDLQTSQPQSAFQFNVDPRFLALEALGKIGGKESALALAACAENPMPDAAAKIAIRALAETNAREAVIPLASLYTRVNNSLKPDVMAALAQLAPLNKTVAEQALRIAQMDPSPEIAATATDLLENLQRSASN